MATQAKLYTVQRQTIPPNTWVQIRFDTALRNDDGMWFDDEMGPESALITPALDGDFIWTYLVRFDSITIPAGDTEERQFHARYVRDPYTLPDNTGESDHDDTVGKDLLNGTWLFRGHSGQPVALEVRHNHTEPVDVDHAQFSATTWDY